MMQKDEYDSDAKDDEIQQPLCRSSQIKNVNATK